jgi:dihydrofolate reductase
MNTFNIITAYDLNKGIGYQGKMPWHIIEDMQYFKEKTLNNIVVMGRKTFESLNCKPLPNRINIVLTTMKDAWYYYKVMVPFDTIITFCSSVGDVLRYCEKFNKEVWVIGGSDVYKQFLDIDIISSIYITELQKIYNTNTKFPEIPKREWNYHELYKKNDGDCEYRRFVIRKKEDCLNA